VTQTCPMTPGGRSECARELATRSQALGMAITVSAEPPATPSPYGEEWITCPHGVTYWIEPTGEQICAWVEAGVE
jgi:hypothetical protein